MSKLFFDKLAPEEQAAVAWEADRRVEAQRAEAETRHDAQTVKWLTACKDRATENQREHIAIDPDAVAAALCNYTEAIRTTFKIGQKRGQSE
jgi:hypothetical protein